METLNKCIRYIFFGKTDVSYPSARKKKSDLNEVLPDNWSFIEDPLKKNLADYLIDNNITKSKEDQNFWLTNSSPPLTSFLDEYRMEKANSSVYNDEFKFCSAHWHTAKSELTQNNSVGNQTVDREVVKTSQPINIDMNPKIHDCYQAASQCSSKLEELKLRLSNKTRSKRDNKTYIRKPKKQFVEASLVEDGYEEPFESDDLDMMGNVDYIEFNNFGSVMYENLHQVDAALTKINDNSKQHKEMSTMKINKSDISDSDPMDTSSTVSKDKEGFPKEKRKRSRKKACKFFRIPSQNSDSEAASSFEQSPVMFMSHIDLPSSCDQTPSSLELPISFRQNLSSESLDNRKLSTTESEDSFIQFCDNGEDSCSESSVFDSNDEDYDSDSDSDVESGDITSALSKSVSNLTDDVLYAENTKTPLPDEDQVDCAKLEQEIEESKERKSAGILVNSAKKSAYKDKPQKTVRFSTAPPRVKVMRVWAFAARCARAGHWERYVADRDRFKKRIADVEMAISWVLKPQHRTRILFQRIRPWLNAQKRKEDAERKAKEEAEILKREQEALNVRKSENQILVALDVNENELNTNSKQNKSELQNTQDDNTIQENMEKESSNETFKEEKQSKESKCELKNRTEEIKDPVTSELRNITGKNGNLDDNVRNDLCSNSGSASRCACNKEEEAEVFENESSHKVHVIDDKFITKEEKIVKISSNNCGIHVQKPISKNECKNISNRNTIEDDSKNIEISNLKSKSEKKRNHNSMQQNRNFSSKTNKIVGTKELKVNILSGDVTEKKLQPNDNVLHKNFENQKLPKSPKVSSRSKRDVSKRDDEMMNYLPKDVPLEIIAKPFSV